MNQTINVIKKSLSLVLAKEMMYKFNFFVRFLTLATFDLIIPLMTFLTYQNTNGFPNWNIDQMLLFQSIAIFVNGLDRTFFWRAGWTVADEVRNGTFDRLLLLPINTIKFISFKSVGLEHLGEVIISIALMSYTIIRLNITITASILFMFFLFVLLSMIFYFSILLIRISIIVVNIKAARVGELTRTIKSFASYPTSIFGKAMSFILRYIFPLAIIAQFPAELLLGRISDNIFIIGIVIITFYIISNKIWKNTLKKYVSAGG